MASGASPHLKAQIQFSKNALSVQRKPSALLEGSRSLTTPGVVCESVIRKPLTVYERTGYANVREFETHDVGMQITDGEAVRFHRPLQLYPVQKFAGELLDLGTLVGAQFRRRLHQDFIAR